MRSRRQYLLAKAFVLLSTQKIKFPSALPTFPYSRENTSLPFAFIIIFACVITFTNSTNQGTNAGKCSQHV